MALKTCHDCGGEYSTDAKNCPHCGAYNKPSEKGVLIVVLCVVAGIGWMGLKILFS